MSEGAKAMDFTVVPLPSCPCEFDPVHHTVVFLMMHVCSLPAAGDDNEGTVCNPGVFGAAECATGAAIATQHETNAVERIEKSFMGFPHASEGNRCESVALFYRPNCV